MKKDENTTAQESRLINIDIEKIQTDPDQPRRYFDDKTLGALSDSIKGMGVLQPILVRKNQENDAYIIVAGERRFRAALKAGLAFIPSILVKNNPRVISLVENLQREDLTPIEEAEAIFKLKLENKYSETEIGQIVGKAKSTISEILTLMKLPQKIKDYCRNDRGWSRARLLKIAKQPSDEDQFNLYRLAKKKNLKGEQLRAIRTMSNKTKAPAEKEISSAVNALKRINTLLPSQVPDGQKDLIIKGMQDLIILAQKIQARFGAPNP